MQVVLDTSAWINVSTRVLVSQLSERAAQLQTRLAVPKEVLGELLAQPDHERAWTHIRTMASVDDRSKVFLSAGFGALHKLECERTALKQHRPSRVQPGVRLTPMPCTPTMDRREATLLTSCLRDKTKFDREAASMRANATEYLDVQRTWELDKRARSIGARLGEGFPPADFRNMIMTGYPRRLAAAHFFEKLLPRRAWRERALRQPHMFSTTLLWALCQELSGWGVLQAAVCPNAVEWLETVKKNTWVDNKIAASAAYADRFVTDDVGLLKRVEFAARVLRIRLQVQSLDEFLAV